MLVELPFGGFYESFFDGCMDNTLENMAEGLSDEREDGVDYERLLFQACNWRKAQRDVARAYGDSFGAFFEGVTRLKVKFTYESMESPREYNFATDRIFATVSLAGVRRLYKASAMDNHAKLAALLERRYTRRDGFWPNYSNDIAVWLAKPLAEWDHNEVGTLLQAVLGMSVDEIEQAMMDDMYEDIWTAIENAIDWPAVERNVRAKVGECDGT